MQPNQPTKNDKSQSAGINSAVQITMSCGFLLLAVGMMLTDFWRLLGAN